MNVRFRPGLAGKIVDLMVTALSIAIIAKKKIEMMKVRMFIFLRNDILVIELFLIIHIYIKEEIYKYVNK
jgi:hypothetical protein